MNTEVIKFNFVVILSFLFLFLFLGISVAMADDDPVDFIVSYANISVDGSVGDWQGVPKAIEDPIGDKMSTLSGTDISSVYLAYDENYFYVRLDLADGNPNNQDIVYYSLLFNSQETGSVVGDKYLRSQFFPNPEQNRSVLREIISVDPYQAVTIAVEPAAAGQSTLEMRVPLDKLNGGRIYFYARATATAGPVPPGPLYDYTSQLIFKIPFLNVPKYYQFKVNNPNVDPNWPDTLYDYLTSTTTETIRYYGCALTSSVMLLRFHNVLAGIDQKDVNPYNLNGWLKDNEGYLKGGNLKFEQLVRYSNNIVQKDVFWDAGQKSLQEIENRINSDLANGRPVLVKTEYINAKGLTTPHYIVAKGVKRDTWFINDPGFSAKTTLADYQNKILGIRTFKIGVGIPLPKLTFYFASPGELFLTDPLGRRTGIDPETNQFFAEIPNSSYVKDEIGADFEGERTIGPVKSLDVSEPLDGDYKLQIIGTNTGNYALTSDIVDQNGNFQSIPFGGITKEGIISTFNIDYSSTPGEPSKVERVVTIRDAIKDIEISYELGWITKKSVKDILITKLKVAQRLKEQKENQIQHFNELIEKTKNPKAKQKLEEAKERYEEIMNKTITIILEFFIKEVEVYFKKGYINDKASELLINDVEYIVKHL